MEIATNQPAKALNTPMAKKKTAATAAQPNFDRGWFLEQMRRAGVTQRVIADRLGRDESAVSLMLRGRRRIRLDEAAELAKILGVSYDEVVERAGVQVPSMSGGDTLPIQGYIDGAFNVVPKRPPHGPRKVTTPYPGVDRLTALRVIAPNGGAEVAALDGAVLYYQAPADDYVDPDCINKMSVVETADGRRLLRVVRRGYDKGTYTLASTAGEVSDDEAEVRLQWAAPVLFVKLD